MGIKRYDLVFKPSLLGGPSEMETSTDGDWVSHEDHVAEVHRMQRQVIAALGWRAGEKMVEYDRLVGLVSSPENRWIAVSIMEAANRDHAEALSLARAAGVMEEAL